MNVSKAVNQFEFYIATASVAARLMPYRRRRKKYIKPEDIHRMVVSRDIIVHCSHTHTVFFNSIRKNKKCNTHRRMEWSFTLFPKILREKKRIRVNIVASHAMVTHWIVCLGLDLLTLSRSVSFLKIQTNILKSRRKCDSFILQFCLCERYVHSFVLLIE